MPMTEDFSSFLSTTEHATTGIYKTNSIVGIFENSFVEVNGVQSVKPTFLVSESDVPSIVRGNTITIDNVAYTFIMDQPDGTGMTMLILEAPR